MSEQMQIIVSHLNKEPFNMNLRMVELDEKGPLELLQILNDVFTYIDSTMRSDIRKEEEQKRGKRMMDFIRMLRYKGIPTNNAQTQMTWFQNLVIGSKDIVYPLLAWCLSTLKKLKKRAYLAPFLTPVELPLEVSMQDNGELLRLSNKYSNLQEEFKQTHSTYENIQTELKESESQGLKSEIQQLESEKRQLKERIEDFRAKVKGDDGFQKILEATSSMRKEQDQEVRLREKALEQKENLAVEEEKLQQLYERHKSLSSIQVSDNGSIESIITEIQNEVRETTNVVRSDLVIKQNKLRNELKKYERQIKEPARTEEDLNEIQESIHSLEQECNTLAEELSNAKSKNKNDKISMYKQHVNNSIAKVRAAELDLKRKQEEHRLFEQEVNSLIESKKLDENETSIENEDEDIQAMKGDLVKVELSIETLSKDLDELKVSISLVSSEILILQRTEDIIQRKRNKFNDYLETHSSKEDIAALRKTRSKLKNTHEQTQVVNENKCQTLEDISSIVTKMTTNLVGKQEKLQPMVKQLKTARLKSQELQKIYETKKTRYEKFIGKLSADRSALEKECNRLQLEWLDEERNFHYLVALNDIAELNLSLVEQEHAWREGIGTFLPEFDTMESMYQNKITQQENLSNELRKEQRWVNENMEENLKQRKMFQDLAKIINLKIVQETEKKGGISKEMLDTDQTDIPTNIGNAQVLLFEGAD